MVSLLQSLKSFGKICRGLSTTNHYSFLTRSNCVPRIMKALRRHYSRPSFLPQDSESSYLDWMFMGGSGTGAMMHVSIQYTDTGF